MPANKFNLYAKPIPYPTAFEEIFEKLKNLAFRIADKDWLDVPEEVTNIIELELPKSLEKQYEVLRKEFIVELESLQVITAQSAGVLSTKLRQFLSGQVYVGGKVEHVHRHKMDALAEFIEDNEGTPILVGYQYQHEAARFKELFKNAEFINSSTTATKLDDIMTRWNAGKIPLLFGHPQSIGHGLNLQEACNNVVFYSLDFNLENHLQFIKRIARQGQKQSHVFIHYLTFKDTIDEHLIKMLIEKKSLQDMLLDYITIEKEVM
jgi:SNF2 family DNA or RNA helicase